jgi:hypothetical protein
VHVPADAEAVVELRDLGALSELREMVEARFAEVIPASDMATARAEIERALGFDPFTPEGLKKAGLPDRGRVAGGVSAASAIWVFPVADGDAAKRTVGRLVEARTTAEESEVTVDGVKLTRYARTFGDETAEVAAFVARGRLGYLGLGADATRRVARAVGLAPAASVAESAEHAALAEELGDGWLLRGIFPNGGQLLESALEEAGQTARVDEEAMKGVKSAGWTLRLGEAGLSARGHLRLAGEALAQAERVFAADEGLAAGVRALALPNAILFAAVNGDAGEMLERLAPPGSRPRRRLTQLLASVGMKGEEEVLSDLTGQGALALGVGDLSEVAFKRLMGNPMSVVWSALALGVKSPEKLARPTDEMKAGLEQRGFESKTTEVEGTKVTSVVQAGNPEALLVQSFALPEALVYANEPAVTKAVLASEARAEPLNGEPGILVEARIGQLARQLRTFQIGELPVMFRAMIARGIDALTLFDDLSVVVKPHPGGLRVDGALTLAPPLREK